MHICILTSSFPRTPEDPAGIFIYNLAKWLAQKNIHVSVVAPHDKGCRLLESRDGIKIFRFPYFFPFKLQKLCYGAGMMKNIQTRPPVLFQIPFFILCELFCTALIAKKLKPDILHAHWSIPQGLTGVLVKQLLHIPCMTTVHGSDIFGLSYPYIRKVNRWLIRHSDICTANSTATANATALLSGKPDVTVIPMGVDTEFFSNAGEGDIRKDQKKGNGHTILFVGRLIEVKGVDRLIRAMPNVFSAIPGSRLVIVGDGPLKAFLVDLSRQLGISDRVVFAGAASPGALRRFYADADVFVLPSIVHNSGETEGLGVVLLEAMSSGVPVIGSRTGGIVDIIKHESTGLLVPPESTMAMSESIVRLFENGGLNKAIAEKGKQFAVSHFSWDAVSDKFISLYHAMLHL